MSDADREVPVSPRITERIGHINYDRGQLWWAIVAIHEPPAYSAAADIQAGSTIAWKRGRYRPIPELSGYKMLLDNVYNCSSNMRSGSGTGRGSSVN